MKLIKRLVVLVVVFLYFSSNQIFAEGVVLKERINIGGSGKWGTLVVNVETNSGKLVRVNSVNIHPEGNARVVYPSFNSFIKSPTEVFVEYDLTLVSDIGLGPQNNYYHGTKVIRYRYGTGNECDRWGNCKWSISPITEEK